MLSDLLYYLFPYQIFSSVFFRGGMGFLTTYFLISFFMPYMIRFFRKKGYTSDFKESISTEGPYQGATPIMGGVLLIPSILISIFLWVWLNPYTIASILLLMAFSLIGFLDDISKIIHKRNILCGKEQQKSYTSKADGMSGKIRITLEFLATGGVIAFLHSQAALEPFLHVPMVPIKTWFPEFPLYIFIPFILVVIVGGANAVNLTDGLDSLATIPILTCALFAASAAYVTGDEDWSRRLLFIYVGNEMKEVTIIAIIIMGSCIAFLKFNSPPASIYMGDVGSLGLGAVVSAMFVFVKAELYLPIVGGTFFIAALSSIIQRCWFQCMKYMKGREYALKHRFFYRAPYHHHQQALLTYQKSSIFSVLDSFFIKLGLNQIHKEDKYLNKDYVNNKVIWRNHIASIWLLVIALIIYFKVR